ncbi:hypothetical protein [Arthrobacter sp. NEB 688]|uniref:hypothetical protein n=1 Tax=Arthrobacter sp. NEB 688 TaxID=904039 RepID=UPI001563921E|nr:hypothetical protein [Arthrobacter sp. NEB 688]QKE84973.1 hypothetical protein HL663_14160 [Arthrobacter sp. NEB 688]
MSIRRTEVAGVPTLHRPGQGSRVSAGLLFRVGEADETLAVRGVTRLVEALVNPPGAPLPEPPGDGLGDVVTAVTAHGTADEVAARLAAAVRALRALPVHRLEAARAEVLGHDHARAPDVGRLSAMVRWGARGRGLRAYPLVGLPALDAEVLDVWSQVAFTRENAVLWWDGPLSPHVDLPLPSGERQPLPDAPPVTTASPAWFPDPAPLVHLTGLVPRGAAALAHQRVLERALHEELVEPGLAPGVEVRTVPHDARTALVTVTVPASPGREDALAGGVVDALERVRRRRLDATDRALVEALAQECESAPPQDALAARAADLLLGRDTEPADDDPAALRAVTPAEIRAVAEALHASALAQVPGTGLDWAGWSAVPATSSAAVTGREHAARAGDRATLLLGPEGTSLRTRAGVVTVRWDEVAAMEAFADGGRWVVGLDGFRVHVEPTVFELEERDVAEVDAAVDPARVVHLPARPADALPRPSTGSDPDDRGRRRPALFRRR